VEVCALDFVDDEPAERGDDVCKLEVVDDPPAKRPAEVCQLEIVDSPDEECELEVVEEAPPEEPELEVIEVVPPEPVDDIIDLELADGEPPVDDTPLPRRLAAKSQSASSSYDDEDDDEDDEDDEEPERPRKKRKPKKPRYDDADHAKGEALYIGSMANADVTIRAREERKKKAWRRLIKSLSRFEDGLQIGGIYISGGVVIGTILLAIGLLGLAVVGACFSQGVLIHPRIIIGAAVCTFAGFCVLVQALVFGRE
jgi:hypothetical protein